MQMLKKMQRCTDSVWLWGRVPGGSSSFPWRQQTRADRTEQKGTAVKCVYVGEVKSLDLHAA